MSIERLTLESVLTPEEMSTDDIYEVINLEAFDFVDTMENMLIATSNIVVTEAANEIQGNKSILKRIMDGFKALGKFFLNIARRIMSFFINIEKMFKEHGDKLDKLNKKDEHIKKSITKVCKATEIASLISGTVFAKVADIGAISRKIEEKLVELVAYNKKGGNLDTPEADSKIKTLFAIVDDEAVPKFNEINSEIDSYIKRVDTDDETLTQTQYSDLNNDRSVKEVVSTFLEYYSKDGRDKFFNRLKTMCEQGYNTISQILGGGEGDDEKTKTIENAVSGVFSKFFKEFNKFPQKLIKIYNATFMSAFRLLKFAISQENKGA